VGDIVGFLLGTRRVVLGEGSTWDFAFATPVSVVWFVLAGAVIAAGVTVLYWRESTPLNVRQRLFFVTMRMLVVAVILTMLAEPSVFVSTSTEGRATVAVMLDTSESMSIPDAYRDEALRRRAARAAGILAPDTPDDVALTEDDRRRLHEMTRTAIVQRAIGDERTAFFKRLAEHFGVAVYTFDSHPRLVAGSSDAAPGADAAPVPDLGADLHLDPVGKSTDISTGIRTAVNDARTAKRTLAALVLVSDGRPTGGSESVVHVAGYARQRGVPVLTVAAGDPSRPKDVKLTALLVNNTAFVDDPTQVSFVLESAGFEGERVHVELLEGDRLLKSKTLVLLRAGKQQRETFTFKPRTPGKHTYTVHVRPLHGEFVEANNTASALIQIIKDKIKVLYVEGGPRWEYRFLKNALVRDESLLVSCLLASAEYGFIQEGTLRTDRFPNSPEDLFKYNVVILGDVDDTMFTTRQIDLMKEFVERLGGGMVFLSGERHMPRAYRTTGLGAMIPVVYDAGRDVGVNRAPKGLVRPFRPVLTEAGKEHPITLLAEDQTESERLWRMLPGLFWHFPVTRAKPGAMTLLVHPTQSRAGKPIPLLVASFYGAGRVLYLGIDETWRWRYGKEDEHFYRFWGQIIRYLRAGRQVGQGQRYSITTYKPEYMVGEQIIIRARLLDRSYRPVALKGAEAAVALPGGEDVKVPLEPTQPGVYEGQTRAIRAGMHEVRLIQPRPELQGEKAAYSFLVKRTDVEFRDTRADHMALTRLAQTSGGKFFHVDELAKVVENLRAQRRLRIERAQFPLWDAPIFFLIFFAAICAEWIYRKRRRLL